jgi:hypothetical protein
MAASEEQRRNQALGMDLFGPREETRIFERKKERETHFGSRVHMISFSEPISLQRQARMAQCISHV